MGQLLRIALVLFGLWLIIRVVRRFLGTPPRQEPPSATDQRTPSTPMLRCDHCGVYLPRAEATLIEGKAYCSQKHADAERQG